MTTRTDKALVVLTALVVACVAVVAGAISFDHMRELANHHDQLGWKSFALPVSVDGLEIVASLFLVAQRRAGRPIGWIPWVALVIGTLASLASNIAVGGADLIGRALAGWPAVSMLVSVKLLSAMFDREESQAVPDDQRTVGERVRPSWASVDEGTAGSPVEGDERLRPAPATGIQEPSVRIASENRGRGNASADSEATAELIRAARFARARLEGAGRSLSRDNLAEALRSGGYGVSNVRASVPGCLSSHTLASRVGRAEGWLT